MNGHVSFLADVMGPGVSERLCVTLLHSLWQAGLAAGVAALVSWAACPRGRGHGTRGSVEWKYAVHVGALVVTLIALLVTYSMTLGEGALRSAAAPAVAAEGTTSPVDDSGGEPMPWGRVGGGAEGEEGVNQATETRVLPINRAKPRAAGDVSGTVGDRWTRFAPIAAVIYLIGVAGMLARLMFGLVSAERIRSAARPILAGAAAEALGRLVRTWKLRAAPALAQAERVAVPTLVGLLKPTILLPGAALSGLTTGELEMILAHELAHVRRRDMWVNLLQRVAEVVLFFNPALWWLSRRISTLREYCCDEMACAARAGSRTSTSVAGDEARIDYAAALFRVVELACAGSPRASDLATLAASGRTPSELRRRVARLLGEPLREPLGVSRGGLVVAGAILLAAIVGPTWVHSQTTTDLVPPPAAAANYPPAKTAADDVVAAARKKTFGLGGVPKISMRLSIWSADIPLMKKVGKQSADALWQARGQVVDTSKLAGSATAVTLAWEASQLLFQSDWQDQKDAADAPGLSTMSYYWTGSEGWGGGVYPHQRTFSREATIEQWAKGFTPYTHVYLPQFVASGGRLTWAGTEIVVDQFSVDPDLARYALVGAQTVDGAECDIYEAPARRERIWIDKSTGLVKALLEYNVHNDVPNYFTNIVKTVAGRTFKNVEEYQAWSASQGSEVKAKLSAFWSASHFAVSEPEKLLVFSDYHEIAPGVEWPMKCEVVGSIPNENWKKDGYHYFHSEATTVDVKEQFSIEKLAAGAIPQVGDKVLDRRAEPQVEVIWAADGMDAEVDRLRAEKRDAKTQADVDAKRVLGTPIASVDEALQVLTEGPKVDPAYVWARAVKYLVDHKEEAFGPTIARLDKVSQMDPEDRDHPMSKLAFALRAMNDPRAVPALIRALPETLLPSRSDFGVELKEDADLLKFMQENDGNERGAGGPLFDYGRAFREVTSALHRLTKKDFGEMDLNWVNLASGPAQRVEQRKLFHRYAEKWAAWWETEGKAMVSDRAYAAVDLHDLPRKVQSYEGRTVPPSGPGVEFKDGSGWDGWIVQSVQESKKRCFVDLDTGREGGWPDSLPLVDEIGVDSPKVLEWARAEGFDFVGVTYTPEGEKEPLYCLKPLDMHVWKITTPELRGLTDSMAGSLEYPLSHPVEMMVPQREIKPPYDAKYGGDAYLFVTREGTAGVIRMTAQVTEVRENDLGAYLAAEASDMFQGVGPYKGAKICFGAMSEGE